MTDESPLKIWNMFEARRTKVVKFTTNERNVVLLVGF